MFAIVLTVIVLVSAIDPSTGCASQDNVTALNNIVNMVKTPLDVILQNSSISMGVKYDTILGLVCDDAPILEEVKKIEQMVASCPELVTASTVGTLQLGPLTFSDLLTNFQSVDHFCKCKSLLLQVLAIGMIQSDIIHSDSSAHYRDVINMTAVCQLTSPSHPVNFTKAAMLIQAHKAECPSVFQYSNISMVRLADFVIKYCEFISPELFACALNFTKDKEFNACLQRVDQNMTSLANNKSIDESYFRCRRTECVDLSMAECENSGIVTYMWSVDIAHKDKQFQWSACVPRGGAATFMSHPSWVLIAVLVHILHKLI